MKNYTKTILLIIAASLLSFHVAYSEMQVASNQQISMFRSDVIVNTDNSIDVTETIVYNTGPTPRHGLFRTLRILSSSEFAMPVDVVSVVDANGVSYPVNESRSGEEILLKIGDPNTTFTGEKTYIIKYHADHAVDQRDDVDELYWNVTGNEWSFPIQQVEATISMPKGTLYKQSACYVGVKGSNDTCSALEQRTESVTYFSDDQPLWMGSGLTVAVGVTKGAFAPYPKDEMFFMAIKKYGPAALLVSFPIFLFVYLFMKWRRVGRDPKGSGVIVPEYDAPPGMSPMEACLILFQELKRSAVTAEIIHLAVHGYIRIEQVTTKVLLFTTKDYRLHLLKSYDDVHNESSKKLLSSLFANGSSSMMISSLTNSFHVRLKEIDSLVRESVLSQEYYKNLDTKKGTIDKGSLIKAVFFMFVFFSIPVIAIVDPSILTLVSLCISVIVSIVIYVIMSRIMPSKTVKGVETMDKLLGLREYLQIAEKDRLTFHNAPEKRPEVFDRLLPFAILFGVEQAWAKEFQDIYTTPPDWYSGAGSRDGFNASMFVGSLDGFSRSASQVMSPPSSSGGSGRSGSSGGGFSGGGGGGGGGGSW
jgi:uncharacterized membrane protein YgcG